MIIFIMKIKKFGEFMFKRKEKEKSVDTSASCRVPWFMSGHVIGEPQPS